MSRHENKLSGLKYILAGLALMALSTAAVEIVFLFKRIDMFNWAEWLIHFLGWILVAVGMYMSKHQRAELKTAFIVSIIGMVATIGYGLLAFKQFRAGITDMAFVDIYVMFVEYIANIAMLGIYFLTVRAMGQLMAKNGDVENGKRSIKLTRVGVGIVLAAFMITPMAYVFPLVIKFILGGAAIFCSVAIQMVMINYVNQGYRDIV